LIGSLTTLEAQRMVRMLQGRNKAVCT